MEKATVGDLSSASVIRGAKDTNDIGVEGRYTMTCIGPDGQEKWTEEFDNLVTAQGKKFLLDRGLYNGTASTIFTRMLLITSGSPTAASTYATPIFTEFANIAARGTPDFSGAASGTDAVTKAIGSAVSFSINAGTGVTVSGCGIVVLDAAAVGNLGVVSDTATANAKLYSAGAFSGGSKSVSSGDTLNVSYTASINAG